MKFLIKIPGSEWFQGIADEPYRRQTSNFGREALPLKHINEMTTVNQQLLPHALALLLLSEPEADGGERSLPLLTDLAQDAAFLHYSISIYVCIARHFLTQ